MGIAVLAALAILTFYRHGKKIVPILMYHRIASVPGDRNSLPEEKFAWQMQYLFQNGFHTVTLAQLYTHYKERQPLPSKPVLLTFDDGYLDNFTTALPILQQYGFSAVVFPIADWVGKDNTWENFGKAPAKMMDWQQLSAWLSCGLEVALHTCTHPFLNACTKERVKDEVRRAQNIFKVNLGRNFDFFCYPYGKFD